MPVVLLALIGSGWWWAHRSPSSPAATAPVVRGQPTERPVDRNGDQPSSPRSSRPVATPTTLTGYTLAGRRRAGCVRLVVGLDVSSSMTGYRTVRDTALAELLRWLRINLRPDDEIAVIDFAGSAGVRQPPTSVTLPIALGPPAAVVGGSRLLPLFDATAGFAGTACTTTVILLSDGQLDDLPASPAASAEVLATRRITHVRLLAPDRTISVPWQWTAALPSAKPVYFDGNDPASTALAIGHTVGELTGTTLRARSEYTG